MKNVYLLTLGCLSLNRYTFGLLFKKKKIRITSKRITQGWYQQHYAFLQKAQKQMLREFIQTQLSALYP